MQERIHHQKRGRKEQIRLNIEKLTILRGKTTEDKKSGIWRKSEYTIECMLTDSDSIEQVKEGLTLLLDAWLDEKPIPKAPSPPSPNKQSNQKKTCAHPNCNKIIASNFKYCYTHKDYGRQSR